MQDLTEIAKEKVETIQKALAENKKGLAGAYTGEEDKNGDLADR